MAESKTKKYFEGIGRRKTAIARVRITNGVGEIAVNGKKLKEYFPVQTDRDNIYAPLVKLGMEKDFSATAKVSGGGIQAQAEAVRLGLARALVISDGTLKMKLRGFGFLTRDPRSVERKKYGLKKARRAPQWAKR